MKASSPRRYSLDTLSRGLKVLEAFSTEAPCLSLTQISRLAGLDRSTAFHYVHRLEELGYLLFDPAARTYTPGFKVLNLGFTVLSRKGLAEIVQPYLEALSAECGETSDLAVLDGASVVVVLVDRAHQLVSIDLTTGLRLPAYCSSSGKAQLIDLSREELCQLFGEGPYAGAGPNSIRYLDALVADLEAVRTRGYAINDEETKVGHRSVAAPIRNRSGKIVAAISVNAASVRASLADIRNVLAPRIVEAAGRISSSLGAKAQPPAAHPRSPSGL